jgi:transposase
MAQSRLPMRKIRDVLRLSAAAGLSKRQIAASLGIGPTAAGACLRRAREAGISWPLVCTENPIRVYRMIESAKLAR